jgi:hypothetical protein
MDVVTADSVLLVGNLRNRKFLHKPGVQSCFDAERSKATEPSLLLSLESHHQGNLPDMFMEFCSSVFSFTDPKDRSIDRSQALSLTDRRNRYVA